MNKPVANPQVRPLIFVHIQKTGGTSIARALGQPVHPAYKHWFAPELRSLVGSEAWDNALKFTFVRNPWDRLVSWWTMIDQVRVMQRSGARLNNFFTYVLSNAKTFEEFILRCSEDIRDPDGMKCIFRNQVDYVVDDVGRLMVDFIGRFESIDRDFCMLAEMAGRTLPALEHRNQSIHKPYQSYYTPTTRDIVGQAYEKDIAYFGYKFED